MAERCPLRCEFVLVDDGSSDASVALMRRYAEEDPRFRVIVLSRNFGQQIAFTAGLDATRGDAVAIMDADLQDPPDVILEMLPHWEKGVHVVYGQRRTRSGDTRFKVTTAKLFYRILGAVAGTYIPPDTGDFRLMDRKVVEAFRGVREVHRYNRGLISWLGFTQQAVLYDRAPRAAGETKYTLGKMVRFAADAISSFSVFPLRVVTFGVGPLITLVGLAWVGWQAVRSLWLGEVASDLSILGALVTLLGGIQVLVLGVLGEYIGRVYEQGKQRPLYVVMDRIEAGRSTSSDDAIA